MRAAARRTMSVLVKRSSLRIVFTIGHSDRPLKDFIDMLKSNNVKKVIDVRTIPRSWHNPQFNKDTLPDVLSAAGISYTHMPGLGGLRRPVKDSLNTGWRNASFRGFADYMQTEEFKKNIEKLTAIAKYRRTALMCAESLPWRCHRSLIADALRIRGLKVKHIMSLKNCKEHVLTPWIKTRGLQITYPIIASNKNIFKNRELR